jgi:hypothetical protein
MLALLSPAKRLDFQKIMPNQLDSVPIFLSDATKLASIGSKLKKSELSHLMKISPELTDLTHERFISFTSNPDINSTKPAAFAFSGDTYVGLDSNTINKENFNFFQKNIRILSGLYGMLRPFDRIQPYRLEMGSKLRNPKGKNLYEYWSNSISNLLNLEICDHEYQIIINLASDEYFKVINQKSLQTKIITPKFYEQKNDSYKMIGFFAKKARGLMARYIIDNKITDPSFLKDFSSEGYTYVSSRSNENNLVFLRDLQQAPEKS